MLYRIYADQYTEYLAVKRLEMSRRNILDKVSNQSKQKGGMVYLAKGKDASLLMDQLPHDQKYTRSVSPHGQPHPVSRYESFRIASDEAMLGGEPILLY